MKEIYLDDYHLHSLTTPDLPTVVSRGVQGLEAPDQRVDVYDNPGTDGQTVANILHGGRVVVMEGTIRGASEEAYRANRAEFHHLVGANRDVSGNLSPRVLKLTDVTGAQYRLNCVVQSLKNPDDLPAFSRWQLQLLATDYRIYSESETTVTLTLPISGGVTLPLTLPFRFGSASGGAATTENHGTAPSFPTVIFHGPMQNPRLSNDTTGQVMGLDITLGNSDTITVDMANRTIVQGENTNRMGTKTAESTFFALPPKTNQLRLAAASYDSGSVTVRYRDAYLGL